MRSTAFLGLLALAVGSSLVACGSRDGDQPVQVKPNPIGTGVHIRDVVDPSKNMAGSTVSISGAVVLTTDTFDETGDGKSRGTVYVQDIGSSVPFSGVSLYSPVFVPSSLRAVPGDTLDLVGQYVTVSSIGTAVFSNGEVLPQLSKPTAYFRYEYKTPDPVVINLSDLEDYNLGFQWENMLVTVKNVVLCDGLANSKGRVTGGLATDCASSTGAPTMSNELMPLDASTYGPGARFTSVTGVVTWFFNFHIAPRSQADLVQ
ncbi:MAG: hypothetical protein ABI551_09945 [Polyangiaceae bacterium]